MKKLLVFLVAICLVVILIFGACAAPAPAPSPTTSASPTSTAKPSPTPTQQLNIPRTALRWVVQGGPTVPAYVIAVAAADAIAKYTPIKIAVGGGFTPVSISRSVGSGEADLMGINPPEFRDAYNGTYSCKDIGPQPDMRIWAGGYFLPRGIVVTNKSGITKPEELRGKPVYIIQTARDWLNWRAWSIMLSYGLDYRKDIMPLQTSSDADTLNGLASGRAVADSWIVNNNPGNLEKAQAVGGMTCLPVEHSEKVMQILRTGGDNWPGDPSVYPVTLQPGDDVSITKPTPMYNSDLCFGVNKNVTDDTVYLMTKAIWEHLPELGNAYGVYKKWKLQTLRNDHVIPFHPGAIRYYKEVGYWTAADDKKQEELLKSASK